MNARSRYTIREVAEAAGATPHTLRYYERAGLMLDVPRNRSGHRSYGEEHVRWIRFVKRLRGAGMPIASVREYACLVRQGDSSIPERVHLLEQHRDRLREHVRDMAEHLDVIEKKLQRYSELGVPCGPDE